MRHPLRNSCWVALAVLTFSTNVWASEEASAGPVQLDYWQAGFTIAVFLILLAILSRFAFRPILNSLKAREEFIAKSISDAEKAAREAQEQLKEYNARLERARAEATGIVEEGRRDAEVVKRSLQEEARKEADAMIERAKREVGVARDTAVRELYDLGAKLATEVAGKILAKEINPQDHQRLIEDSIAELGKVRAENN